MRCSPAVGPPNGLTASMPRRRRFSSGATWVHTQPPDGLTLYAGTNGGTYESADGGDTWLPMVTSDLARAIIIDPSAPNRVYAGMGCGSGALGAVGRGGVKRSVDAGQSWVEAGTLASCVDDFEFVAGTLYLLGENVARSRDRGDTWVTGGPGLQGEVLRVAITPDEETVFVAAADGVYRSVMGGF